MTTVHKLAFPLPTLYMFDENVSVNAGDRVIVNLQDGSSLTGLLIDYDAEQGSVRVDIPDDNEQKIIDFDQIKILDLPSLLKYSEGEIKALDNEQAFSVPPENQAFHVEFKDGDSLHGTTCSFQTDSHGLYLFPADGDKQFSCVFISHAVIQDYTVGPLIGKMLVEDQVVSENEINMSLHIQKGIREKPLGHYLTDKAVVTTTDLERVLKLQKTMPDMKLGEVLLKEKMITEEQLNTALELQSKNRKLPLGKILEELNLLTQTDIQSALADKLGISFVDLTQFEIDQDIISLVSEKLARTYNVLPLYTFENTLVIAVDNPMDWEPVEAIKYHTRMNVKPVMASLNEIQRVISLVYSMTGLDDLSFEEFELDPDDDSETELSESESHVFKLVNKIIIGAYQKGASDIHIEPDSNEGLTVVRIRKDGSLISYYTFPASMGGAVAARIKTMAGLDTEERQKPQDGKIKFKQFSKLKIELHVATLPTIGQQEDIVMRIKLGAKPVTLKEVDLSDRNHKLLLELINKPNGLFIASGPTGSGKTTTLHSALTNLNTVNRKIWTVEDPVEIIHKGMRQIQVNTEIGLDFSTVLHSFLRADPDVIMLGEMRDKEATRTCIEASLKGSLVFSTLHTNSAAECVVRLLDMGIDPFNLADSLLGALSQRLTKKLCPDCKIAYSPSEGQQKDLVEEYCVELQHEAMNEDEIKKMHSDFFDSLKQYSVSEGELLTLYRAAGCKECDDTGYKGRIALHELLSNSDAIRKQIVASATVPEIQHTAIEEGMRTLKQDGIGKIFQGLTDIYQVRRVCIK